MLFNSIHFLVFFPTVVIAYFLLGQRGQRVLLLVASLYFYCVFSVKLVALLIGTAAFDYVMARVIEANHDRPKVKKAALVLSLTVSLGLLSLFKYADFLSETATGVLGFRPWPILNLLLPMGISFYTFETISYVVDVYRGRMRAERSLLDYALFILFFPHLVAGPILRASEILPQFQEKHVPNADRILSGVLLIVWGLLKKVFIADPMGAIAGSVYGSESSPYVSGTFGASALLFATYAFALQIYCDFSAYSTIAIGAGRVLGFRIAENFDKPYIAVSMRDFWRRWHISLSTWLRDYLYIPLGGSRVSRGRTYLNLGITMLLGGLWHGASWTFVIWGLLHGAMLAGERALGVDELRRDGMSTLEKLVRGLVTFHLVCLTWVFFRAPSATQAFDMLRGMVTLRSGQTITATPVLVLVALVAAQVVRQQVKLLPLLEQRPTMGRWLAYAALAVVVIALAGGRSPEFIYFQF
jgi:alginate O-acetyltransferase complex protein AlgI